MNTKALHQLFIKQQQNFTTDTRKITKGAIFFALKGDRFNANTFASKALELGAAYVVIDEATYQIENKTILVDDVLKSMQALATYHRNYLNIPIVSLTGSNGKTTTKELIREVLATQYKVSATVGNLNNHIGVPLTLLSMTAETEIGVVEMGANHQKEIEFLCNLAKPNFGFITNFGKAHIEGFGSEEGIVKGKSEMYDYLASHNGIAFVNQNETRMIEKASKCNCILIDPTTTPLEEVNPFVKLKYKKGFTQSQLIGKYNYNNIIAAIKIGEHFNIEAQNIKKAIENYIPSNNRSQIIEKGSNQIILDAYNANPTSMEAALENLSVLKSKNKCVILGDMFELGDAASKEHLSIIKKVFTHQFNHNIFVGENFYQHKTNQAVFFKSFDGLNTHLKTNFNNTTILIKGSRGMALERVLNLI